jgi:hypothetical protein
MIVKYLGKYDNFEQQENIHLKIGSEYFIVNLDISFYKQRTVIGICSDADGVPRLWDLQLFEVVDARIPNDWVFLHSENNYFFLQPQEFQEDFWDNFHDGDEQAEKIFAQVMEKIRQFHAL